MCIMSVAECTMGYYTSRLLKNRIENVTNHGLAVVITVVIAVVFLFVIIILGLIP